MIQACLALTTGFDLNGIGFKAVRAWVDVPSIEDVTSVSDVMARKFSYVE